MLNQETTKAYAEILKEELVPAMGCTEPIAVAYAGALARRTLGALPERVELTVSGNIIKNVKSVIVPHTGGGRACRRLWRWESAVVTPRRNWKCCPMSRKGRWRRWMPF